MSEIQVTRGSVQDAVSVMCEAAQWLEDRGMPLWTQAEIIALPEQYPAAAFLTLYFDNHPAAAALLTDADPLFWPDIPPGTSGFLHKLSVRRAYAGQGLALRMLDSAAHICKKEGMKSLRLDCDASRNKLIALYQTAGFKPVGVRRVHTETHGTVMAALLARAL